MEAVNRMEQFTVQDVAHMENHAEMTNEEAKGNLRRAIKWNCMPEKEALDMAIKALENKDVSEIVISQLRAERDRLLNVLNEIQAEINTPNRGTCDYFIVDSIEEIINKYKAESENRAKIDCSKTKCEICTNHNYCDYELNSR